MSHPRLCANCGGAIDDHPWPESGPYLRGCIEELKRQIDELRRRLEANDEARKRDPFYAVVTDAEVDMKQGPVPVTFGWLEALAINVKNDGPLSGVHMKIGECPIRYFGAKDDLSRHVYSRLGEVRCDLCHERYRFTSDGRIFSFPCTWAGWLFFEPSVPTEGEALTCRVRCPKCAEKMESYVSSLF